MICVSDLQQGIDAYTRLGFRVYSGGVHHRQGTHNAIAFLQDDYLELLAVRAGERHLASAGLVEFLARGGGFRYVVVQSDDLAADVAAMRHRGVDVGDPIEGGRRTPAGQELRWKVVQLRAGNPPRPVPRPTLSRGEGPARSRCCTAPAAWTPPPAGWRTTVCHRPRAAFAIPESRRCWWGPSTRAAPTSASSARPEK